ncbi:PIN domain nuclease of toxin-antitoxin system [Aminobacter niigataensis]|uniref:PIN domain nuclease of toxin-antitoxin system n=1 Tax=Aminobacter niigataensis TaxID=83265 RepID=A0ABR6L1D7_9HYPH|nr:PIN domain nuclease of toxin-antitoxin system [Aminobacter niigataensis]
MTGEAFLADTHIILWSINDDPRLRPAHRKILASSTIVYASAASVWEIAIKQNIGKLDAPINLDVLLPRMQFTPLAITIEHAQRVAGLPRHHGDPFDRLLIAQAQTENLSILTADPLFSHYDVALA